MMYYTLLAKVVKLADPHKCFRGESDTKEAIRSQFAAKYWHNNAPTTPSGSFLHLTSTRPPEEKPR